MFYDKEIDILGLSQGYTDDDGIYHPGEVIVTTTIPCDVQPYSSDLLYRDYGYNEQVTKRVFCDINSILKSGVYVSYKEPYESEATRYKIKRIIPWDDYMELMLNAE